MPRKACSTIAADLKIAPPTDIRTKVSAVDTGVQNSLWSGVLSKSSRWQRSILANCEPRSSIKVLINRSVRPDYVRLPETYHTYIDLPLAIVALILLNSIPVVFCVPADHVSIGAANSDLGALIRNGVLSDHPDRSRAVID